MADYKKPGILLSFDDDVYYLPASDYNDVLAKIEEIKQALVGEDGVFRGQAKKLDAKQAVEFANVETEDIRALLSKGVTIRPLGR